MSEIKLFKDLAARYLKRPTKRLNRTKGEACIRYVKLAVERFGDRKIKSFSKRDVTLYKEDMLDQGLANGSVNCRMRYFLAVLNYGKKDLELLDRVPDYDSLPEKVGGRVLTDRELELLFSELPPLLSEIAQFGLLTGLRGRNIKRLRWDEVQDYPDGTTDLRIAANATKAGKELVIPISPLAVEILAHRKEKQDNNDEHDAEYIFTHAKTKQPYAVKSKLTGNAWRKACNRAGLEECHFHCLRHTFATRHVEGGTPASVLKELGGWSSMEMVDRYTRLSTSALRQWASNGALIKRESTTVIDISTKKNIIRRKSNAVLQTHDKMTSGSKI